MYRCIAVLLYCCIAVSLYRCLSSVVLVLLLVALEFHQVLCVRLSTVYHVVVVN